jgi:hypothetical protein
VAEIAESPQHNHAPSFFMVPSPFLAVIYEVSIGLNPTLKID